MLAGFHRVNRDGRVPVVNGRHDDRVNVLALAKFPVVGIHIDLVALIVLGVRLVLQTALLPDIADRDRFGVVVFVVLGHGPHVASALTAHADVTHDNLLIRSRDIRRRSLVLAVDRCLERINGDNRSCGGGPSDEFPAVFASGQLGVFLLVHM